MIDTIKLCFIFDGVVEFILTTPNIGPLAEITSQEYTFTDKTDEYLDTPLGKFRYEIAAPGIEPLEISGDEALYSVLKSKMISVQMPEEIDVKAGWLYNGTDFIEN